jgi:hypothetical protein
MSGMGKQWILKLQQRWIIFSAGRVLLLSLAAALLLSVLVWCFFQWPFISFLFFFLITFVLLSLNSKFWNITTQEVARFVDLHFTEVEESTALLLKPTAELSFLEQLQVRKVEDVLAARKQPSAPLYLLKIPLFILAGVMVVSFLLLRMPLSNLAGLPAAAPKGTTKTVKENIPVQITSFSVEITPPAYTARESRKQKQFSITAENGSRLQWQINTSKKLTRLALLFNDRELINLKNTDGSGQSWSFVRTLLKAGFYQVVVEGKKSDFYQLEIIADQPVQIRIVRPGQHSTIDVGRPQKVDMDILLQDDYGISDAYISATIASGKGEAVSFKEQKLSFNLNFAGKKQMRINKLINLRELGMNPGDELYYYISATDNHGQLSRSDMYFVSIQDTAELMSLVGIDNGVNLVPEYFRSERQIIIDTEKLLKEKSSITEAEFKQRSNDLGLDQKMLRLRYGKFLGEESETNIGGDTGHEEEHDDAAHKDNKSEGSTAAVEEIMDQYAHKHDNAEDATFFEPQLKAQLKATLTEMWNAELRLRTYKPEEALPFEYKALRLLKDLQQKSRAYVAKTTFKTSKLKMEKRLSAELTDIGGGLNKGKLQKADSKRSQLEQAIAIVENKGAKQPLSAQERFLLVQVQHALTDQASAAPAIYLPALKSLKKILTANRDAVPAVQDIANVSRGIHTMLGKSAAIPYSQINTNSSALSQSYFNHLKRAMPGYGN